MPSKLNKMLGIARVASHTQEWKGFTLRSGCAYGLDADGIPFASFGVRSTRYGMAGAKPQHIIVFRCINYDTAMPKKTTKTVWGYHSTMIGRRPIIVEAGTYAAPWAFEWDYTQIPYTDPLAKEIFRALNNFHR